MSAVIVATLCVINLFLWFMFFHKFTKIFSTADIIENTRNELNKMIIDVNRNAERNINLIEDRIKTLKELIAEADKRVTLAQSEEQKKAIESEYRKTLRSASAAASMAAGGLSSAAQAAGRYKRNAQSVPANTIRQETDIQTDLFAAAEPEVKIDQPVHIEPDGTAYKTVPVITPKVFVSDNPVKIKKDFNTEVKERYEQGETVEEIAAALSSSITEVQFALDMNI